MFDFISLVSIIIGSAPIFISGLYDLIATIGVNKLPDFYIRLRIVTIDAISGVVHPIIGGVEKILSVHIYFPGCPPRPEAILFGLGRLLGLVNQKITPGTIYASMGVKDRVYGVLFNERLYKDLRYYLTRYVGYYDREYILEDMLKIINSAKTLSELREKIIDRAAKLRDPRLREVYSIAGGFILEKIREEIRAVQAKR